MSFVFIMYTKYNNEKLPIVCVIFAASLPTIAIVLTIPGFMEKRVSGDSVKVVKFWITTKELKISEINKIVYGCNGPCTKYYTSSDHFCVEVNSCGAGTIEKRIQYELEKNPNRKIQMYQYISDGGRYRGEIPFVYEVSKTYKDGKQKRRKVLDYETATKETIELYNKLAQSLKKLNVEIPVKEK